MYHLNGLFCRNIITKNFVITMNFTFQACAEHFVDVVYSARMQTGPGRAACSTSCSPASLLASRSFCSGASYENSTVWRATPAKTPWPRGAAPVASTARCQFHQHFMSSFFVLKCFAKLLCSYSLGL